MILRAYKVQLDINNKQQSLLSLSETTLLSPSAKQEFNKSREFIS